MEEWIPAGCVYSKVRPSSTTPLPAVSAAFAKKWSQVKAAVGWLGGGRRDHHEYEMAGRCFHEELPLLADDYVLAVRGRWESSTQKVNDCWWG